MLHAGRCGSRGGVRPHGPLYASGVPDLSAILADVRAHFWVYLSMPVIASIIGYTTKLVAIRMMFQPIEFIGIRPYLGWQGIIPRRAERMAAIACETITAKLISTRDVFARLDPAQVAREIEVPLLYDVEFITHEVMAHYQPTLWNVLPKDMRRLIVARVKADAPAVVRDVMQDVKDNLDSVFDLEQMVVANLVHRKELLNRIFQESGAAEFRFIARSGIYFGFLIGLVQLVVWTLTHEPMVMPLFGLFTGWFTDWLALKMLFHPKEPVSLLGLVSWQGLFLKRRREVSAAYGELIARELITPRNIARAVLTGPHADRFFAMVQNHIQRMLDETTGIVKPLLLVTGGAENYQQMKTLVTQKLMERLPETLRSMENYAEEAMDVRATLVTKLQELTPVEFEGILRPAFRQDEWILIAVGAILGFLVGELQVFLVTH